MLTVFGMLRGLGQMAPFYCRQVARRDDGILNVFRAVSGSHLRIGIGPKISHKAISEPFVTVSKSPEIQAYKNLVGGTREAGWRWGKKKPDVVSSHSETCCDRQLVSE